MIFTIIIHKSHFLLFLITFEIVLVDSKLTFSKNFDFLQTLVPPVMLRGPEVYLGAGIGDPSTIGMGGGGGGGDGDGEGEKSANRPPIIFPRLSS